MGQAFINALGDLAVAVGDFGARIIELGANSLNELFKHLDPATNPIAKACIDSFTNFVEQIKNFVVSFGDALELFMESGGQEFINNMGDIILLLADLAASLGGDIIQLITGFMNSWAGQLLIQTAAAALELISKALKGLLELLNGPLKPLVEGLLGALLAFGGIAYLAGVFTKIMGTVQMLSSALGMLWGVIMANPIAAIIALLVGLAVAFVSLYNNCETFRTVVDNMWNAIKGIFEAIGNALSNIIEDIKNIFGNIIDIIVGIFTGDGQRVGEAVKELGGNILQLLGDIVLGVIDIGVNIVIGLAKGIWEGIKSIPTILKGVGTFIIDFFKGLFGIHSPSTVFAEIGKMLIEGLVKGLKDIANLHKALFDMATKLISSATEKFKEVGSKLIDFIKDGVKNAASKLSEVGKNVVEGLKKGITGAWDTLKETGKSLGKKVKDGFCNFLGIQSPSKVMQGHGKDVVDGLSNGVKNNSKSLADVARSMGLTIDKKTIEGMANMARNMGAKIRSIATSTGNSMKSVTSAVVNSFSGLGKKVGDKLNTVRTAVRNCVTKIKNAFKFTWSLPKLKLPHIQITGKWGFNPPSWPKFSVKWYRNGGLIDQPTRLGPVAGAGESGREVVVPLENSTFANTFAQVVGDKLSQAISVQLSNKETKNSKNNDGPRDIILKLNEREFARTTINSLNRYQKEQGRTLLRV